MTPFARACPTSLGCRCLGAPLLGHLVTLGFFIQLIVCKTRKSSRCDGTPCESSSTFRPSPSALGSRVPLECLLACFPAGVASRLPGWWLSFPADLPGTLAGTRSELPLLCALGSSEHGALCSLGVGGRWGAAGCYCLGQSPSSWHLLLPVSTFMRRLPSQGTRLGRACRVLPAGLTRGGAAVADLLQCLRNQEPETEPGAWQGAGD